MVERPRVMASSRPRSACERAWPARGLKGKRLGRPRIDAKLEQRIRAALAKGDRGILKIATDPGVGSGTMRRAKVAAHDQCLAIAERH
jgi:hypothetical protein